MRKKNNHRLPCEMSVRSTIEQKVKIRKGLACGYDPSVGPFFHTSATHRGGIILAVLSTKKERRCALFWVLCVYCRKKRDFKLIDFIFVLTQRHPVRYHDLRLVAGEGF
ncbi:MAG: hypothetical protein J6E42_00925, partial [Firmicutes bacterium]|nr:hypothetical protein [Bacillota bacterium]